MFGIPSWLSGLSLQESIRVCGSPRLLDRGFFYARVLAQVRHPCVLTIHELGHSAEGPYLVAELVEFADQSGQLLALSWHLVACIDDVDRCRGCLGRCRAWGIEVLGLAQRHEQTGPAHT